MPDHATHVYVDKLLFGHSYWRLHKEIDKPIKYLGKYHRVLFHDPFTAYLIAKKLYPNDSMAVYAAQCHITLDRLCTADPHYKKMLTQIAKFSSRRKARSRKPRRSNIDALIPRSLNELLALLTSASS